MCLTYFVILIIMHPREGDKGYNKVFFLSMRANDWYRKYYLNTGSGTKSKQLFYSKIQAAVKSG